MIYKYPVALKNLGFALKCFYQFTLKKKKQNNTLTCTARKILLDN